MAFFENVFQPAYEELMLKDFHLKGKWSDAFFGNNAPLIVELGCGKGEYTVALASRYPEKNFIGVDIKGARIYIGARQAIREKLTNVAFVRTRIENVDLIFGPGEVSGIWLTFPDPQMKDTRKRLTSTGFLARYEKFLAGNGIIHLKTDSAFQYNYTQALVLKNRFKILGSTDDLHHSGLLNDITGIRTFYEKQWTDRGIPIKYLAFIPEGKDDLTEPDEIFEKDGYRSFGRSARM